MGKEKSGVRPRGSRARPRRIEDVILGSWECVGSWGAAENVRVVSWSDPSEGGMGGEEAGASAATLQKG